MNTFITYLLYLRLGADPAEAYRAAQFYSTLSKEQKPLELKRRKWYSKKYFELLKKWKKVLNQRCKLNSRRLPEQLARYARYFAFNQLTEPEQKKLKGVKCSYHFYRKPPANFNVDRVIAKLAKSYKPKNFISNSVFDLTFLKPDKLSDELFLDNESEGSDLEPEAIPGETIDLQIEDNNPNNNVDNNPINNPNNNTNSNVNNKTLKTTNNNETNITEEFIGIEIYPK
jgi:hypothetical protein